MEIVVVDVVLEIDLVVAMVMGVVYGGSCMRGDGGCELGTVLCILETNSAGNSEQPLSFDS